MRKLKRALIAFILALSTVGVTSCNPSATEDGLSESAEYSEQAISLPEAVEGICYMDTSPQGHLRIIGSSLDGSDCGAWEYDGKDWSKAFDLATPLSLSDSTQLLTAAFIGDQIFCCTMSSKEETEFSYYKVNPQGDFSTLSIDLPDLPADETDPSIGAEPARGSNAVSEFIDGREGEVIVSDLHSRYFNIDKETGEVLFEYGDFARGTLHANAAVSQNQLSIIRLTDDGSGSVSETTQSYDLSTGDPANQPSKSITWVHEIREGGSLFDNSNVHFTVLDDSSTLSCSNYSIDILTPSDAEVHISNPGFAFASPNNRVLDIVGSSSKRLYALYLSNDREFLLRQYERKEAFGESKKLTIYSMRENLELRQTVSLFCQKNPGIEVDLKVILDNPDAQIDAEAMRSLVRSIRSEPAACVIAVDGLPVDVLKEMGLLANLEDLANDDGSFFTNVTRAYEENGAIPAIPIRFTFPSIIMDKNALPQATSIDDLISSPIGNDSEPHVAPVYCYDALPCLLSAMGEEELLPSGKPDTWKIESFLQDLAELDDCLRSNEASEAGKPGGGSMLIPFNSALPYSKSSLNGEGLLDGRTKAEIGNVMSCTSFCYSKLLIEKSGRELAFEPLAFGSSTCFVPTLTLGVSSTNADNAVALQFVAFSLSEEPQLSDQRCGLPVNKTSFELKVTEQGSYILAYDEFQIEGRELSMGDAKSLIELISGLQGIDFQNETARQVLTEKAIEVLQGTSTAAAASEELDREIASRRKTSAEELEG